MNQQTVELIASAWFSGLLNSVKPASKQIALKVTVYAGPDVTWPAGGIPQGLFAAVQVGRSGIRVRDTDGTGAANVRRVTFAAGQSVWEGEFLLQAGTRPIVGGTKISVLFTQGNTPVGKIDVDLADHPEWRRVGTVEISLKPSASPDFVVYVMRRPHVWLDLAVSCPKAGGAGLLFRELGSFVDPALDGGSKGLSVLMEEFWTLTGLGAKATRKAARDLGRSLWNMLPNDFHDFYKTDAAGTGAMRDRSDATVQISSEEWYFPWEMVTPPAHGGQPARILGSRFAISRWKHGQATPGSIAVSDVTVVATEIGDSHADDEAFRLRAYGLSLQADVMEVTGGGTMHTLAAGGGSPVVPGNVTFEDFDRLFLPSCPQVIHIRTHGRQEAIQYSIDGSDSARPGWLMVDEVRKRGPVFRSAPRSPFVFLNACNTVANTGLNSVQTGGWPEALYMAGSAAFVAPYWVVLLQSAKVVTDRFYDELEAGKSFARAMQKIRQGFYEDPDGDDSGSSSKPTYLAYTVCGHPNASLVAQGLEPSVHRDPPG